MGRGGYHFWRDDQRWAAMEAYGQRGLNAAVLEPAEEALPEGQQVLARPLERKVAAPHVYNVAVSPQIADEVYGLRISNAQPVSVQYKRTAQDLYDVAVSPQIADEVHGIQIHAQTDAVRRKRVSPQVFDISATFPPPPLGEIPEELSTQAYPNRARKKKAGRSAFRIVNTPAIADEVTGITIHSMPDRALRKSTARHVYGQINLSPQIEDVVDELFKQITPDRARRKVIARHVFGQINQSPQIGDEVYGLRLITYPDMARRKGAALEAYRTKSTFVVPELVDLPIEVRHIVYPSRTVRKRVGNSALYISTTIADFFTTVAAFTAPFSIRNTLNNILAYILASGTAGGGQLGQPIAIAEGTRLYASVFLNGSTVPLLTLSTSITRYDLTVRLYANAFGHPTGDYEVDLADAVSFISEDLLGDVDLGSEVAYIDAGGIYGSSMNAPFGWEVVSGTPFRTADIDFGVVVNDTATLSV